MGKIQIFVSFDLEHDQDLYDLLLAQSLEPASGFEISGQSQPRRMSEGWDQELRSAMCRADEIIFLCGEHTADSMRVSAELGIAQQEDRPYFLVWGRRERMCTRPTGARPSDSMYSWTQRILHDQLVVTLRRAAPAAALATASAAAGGRKR